MRTQLLLRPLSLTAAFLFLFPLIASAGIPDMGKESRPDILVMTLPAVPGQKDMPSVQFKHGLHESALDSDCARCHSSRDGKTEFTFKGTKDLTGKAAMDLFHKDCVACHTEMKGKTGNQGPDAAQCRTCHSGDRPIPSSRKKIEFNRSLHAAHEQAKALQVQGEETNCNLCHHSADMKTRKTFYEKGKESACIYCHTPGGMPGEPGVRSERMAAHDSCVACHLSLKGKKVEAGPVDCKGCHTPEGQSKIKPVSNPPRLSRNQPDTALLTGWASNDPRKNETLLSSHMNAVPFDHKRHEEVNVSCKVCHHKSLDACITCHTDTGSEKGGHVTLAQAMHKKNSSLSCVGCHTQKQSAKECAGCHAQMPEKSLKDNNCAICHSEDVKSLEDPDSLKEKNARALMAEQAIAARTYKHIDLNKIPETVMIKDIEKEYKPSKFPHRLVVESIFKGIETNGMARTFHGSDLTLCAGCHHNSPATMTPPQCASCHGTTPDLATGKPGLKGAFHGQCITCHQKMDVKNVRPTDCTKCHEKK